MLKVFHENLSTMQKRQILLFKCSKQPVRNFQVGSFFNAKSGGDSSMDGDKVRQEKSKDKTIFKNLKPSLEAEVEAEFEKLISDKNDRTATIKIKKDYQLHNLLERPADCAEITRIQGIKMYRGMLAIRRMENACSALYREKVIRGFCHLYIGQEAIAVGIESALRPCDRVITAYRCHGWCYVMGIPVIGIIAELAGREIGVQRGKGGSMHMYNSKFFGGNGIVGGQVPLGAGIALASKYTGSGGVSVSCYGDGAANQGQVFEAYNMACLWKLPCIFVCENNMYGMGTSSKRSSCNDAYYTRGDYVPGLWVDGMDVIASRCATQFAVDYVIKNGPIVMEMHTYRYLGHSMSDPGTSYRTREEIQEIRQKNDPIASFKDSLIENKLLNEDELKVIDEHVKNEIDNAVKASKEAAEIEMAEISADIYSKNLEPIIRGATGYNLKHLHITKH